VSRCRELALTQPIKKIVVAYSGGLDTSVIITWLRETYGCEVIAFTADIGQGEELEPLREKAVKTGASRIYIDDLREEFVRDFVFPLLRANAVYEGRYLLGTSIARPLIAKRQIEIAEKEGADAVCHGATGKGNDQVRFELTYFALKPGIRIVAPWREWSMKGREELIDYADKHRIPVTATKSKPFSTDRNLLHISYEGGVLEDPWASPRRTCTPSPSRSSRRRTRPNTSRSTTRPGTRWPSMGSGSPPRRSLRGEPHCRRPWRGPRGPRGEPLRGHEVPRRVRDAGRHAAPRRSPRRRILTMDREVMHLRDSLIPQYAELVYYGYWFSPERLMLQAAIDESQRNVTGTARLKLYKGNCDTVGRRSPVSLYRPDLATFEADTVYDQKDAEGFIRLNALRLRVGAKTGR